MPYLDELVELQLLPMIAARTNYPAHIDKNNDHRSQVSRISWYVPGTDIVFLTARIGVDGPSKYRVNMSPGSDSWLDTVTIESSHLSARYINTSIGGTMNYTHSPNGIMLEAEELASVANKWLSRLFNNETITPYLDRQLQAMSNRVHEQSRFDRLHAWLVDEQWRTDGVQWSQWKINLSPYKLTLTLSNTGTRSWHEDRIGAVPGARMTVDLRIESLTDDTGNKLSMELSTYMGNDNKLYGNSTMPIATLIARSPHVLEMFKVLQTTMLRISDVVTGA